MHLDNYLKHNNFYGWAIVINDKVIGTIGAFDVDDEMQSCQLGYSIGSKFWGKGIATEAARAVLNFLISEVGFHRVYASHHEENTGSGTVLKNIGMVNEGRLRSATKGRDGKFADLILYSKLDTD